LTFQKVVHFSHIKITNHQQQLDPSPISVTALTTILDLSNTRSMGSEPDRGIDVCPHFSFSSALVDAFSYCYIIQRILSLFKIIWNIWRMNKAKYTCYMTAKP